ncbi:unnamed protein product [Schistosoma turkestanicum]|nr:unnamed protein product [Schistosoma turkestanicum]
MQIHNNSITFQLLSMIAIYIMIFSCSQLVKSLNMNNLKTNFGKVAGFEKKIGQGIQSINGALGTANLLNLRKRQLQMKGGYSYGQQQQPMGTNSQSFGSFKQQNGYGQSQMIKRRQLSNSMQGYYSRGQQQQRQQSQKQQQHQQQPQQQYYSSSTMKKRYMSGKIMHPIPNAYYKLPKIYDSIEEMKEGNGQNGCGPNGMFSSEEGELSEEPVLGEVVKRKMN